MKQKMILTACLAVLGMLSVKAQQSIIALHHQGNVTIFAGAKTQEAMDASVKGDTLYLSEGTFAGFNVTHGIVVLGSGEKTVVSGNITITGNDEKKDLGGYVFSGMQMLHDFVINDSVNGFRISQCQMTNFTVNEGKFLDAGEIVMSYIRGTLTVQTTVQGLEVIATKLGKFAGNAATVKSVTCNHCNINVIDSYHGEQEYRTFQNCIIMECRSGTYLNCIWSYNWHNLPDWATNMNGHSYETNHSIKQDCQKVSFTFDDKLNSPFTDDSLRTAGYLDNDGTVVGITGGDIPYTLELAAPHVAEHKVEVDNVNRKMTVTLKMAHDANKKEEE